MLDHIAAIRNESDAFYRTADGADPLARVPSCPDWSVKDLVSHLTEVHYFWALVVDKGLTDLSALQQMEHPSTPDDYRDLVALGRQMAERMTTTLASADQSAEVWSWASQNDVAFVTRHQVQEAAIHRWDIQAATPAGPSPVAPDVADDSIDEFLRVSLPSRNEWTPGSETVHIHCADTGSDWFLEPSGAVEARPGSADVTISAPASDVLLALYRRVPLEGIDAVLGDVEFT
jgi:uncharacterized protein (TIGR03083 family)